MNDFVLNKNNTGGGSILTFSLQSKSLTLRILNENFKVYGKYSFNHFIVFTTITAYFKDFRHKLFATNHRLSLNSGQQQMQQK